MSGFYHRINGTRIDLKIATCLVAFAVAWTAILAIAYSNSDLHPDVIEAWNLGQTFQWAAPKHPPLMAWIARSWTFIFPVADWSFQLLAMVNSALALWMIDVLARRFCEPKSRVLILMFLLLTPIYQFQAQRFNANSVLFVPWPLAIFCFIRSFESRDTKWAIAAGLTAALTLFGKYYSLFLIVSFVLAAAMHPDRVSYFRSRAPWVSILAGVLLLAPNLYGLIVLDFSPFRFAVAIHGGLTVLESFLSGLSFLLGVAGTLAIPAVLWAVIIRPDAAEYWRAIKSLNAGLLLLSFIGFGTLVIPLVVGLFLKNSLTAVWASPGLFIFVVLAVAAAKTPIDRIHLQRLSWGVLAFTILMILAAPIHAMYRNTHAFPEGRNYFRLATEKLMDRWNLVTALPLKTVTGDRLAGAISFYSQDHPKYFPPSNLGSEWQVPSLEILRAGWATMCFDDEPQCLDWSKKVSSLALNSISFDFVVQPHFIGQNGVPKRIYAVIVPPN